MLKKTRCLIQRTTVNHFCLVYTKNNFAFLGHQNLLYDNKICCTTTKPVVRQQNLLYTQLEKFFIGLRFVLTCEHLSILPLHDTHFLKKC
jgi:hypothetical protein